VVSGVRQRLIFLVFTGLFVTMGLIGTYRYVMEKRDIIDNVRSQGEQSGKLMAGLAALLPLTADIGNNVPLLHNIPIRPDQSHGHE